MSKIRKTKPVDGRDGATLAVTDILSMVRCNIHGGYVGVEQQIE